MTIKYLWENVSVNVPNQNGNEPHTHKKVMNVEYEYERNIRINDIVDYLMPYNLTHTKNKTKEQVIEIGIANYYMTKAIDYLKDHTDLDFEDLEKDEYFVEFMKERYEDDAWEEWQETNEEY